MIPQAARAKGGRVTAERLAHRIPYRGRMLTFRELEAISGVPYDRIRHRARRGLTGDALLAKENMQTAERKIVVGMDVLPPAFRQFVCGRLSA